MALKNPINSTPLDGFMVQYCNNPSSGCRVFFEFTQPFHILLEFPRIVIIYSVEIESILYYIDCKN